MPDTFYHVRNIVTGAREQIDLTDRALADAQCKRMNREAATGVRAAYGEGDDHVAEQQLVHPDSGRSLTSKLTYPTGVQVFRSPEGALTNVPDDLAKAVIAQGYTRMESTAAHVSDEMLLPGSHVGRVLHEGVPVQFEVEVEHRPTAKELEAEARKRQAADERARAKAAKG
jgi:hypothetical protein